MADEFDYDYELLDQYNHTEEESYFYHTLGDFETYVKELGAKYVLTEMSDDVRQLLKGALND
jgi:hypothetical protein